MDISNTLASTGNIGKKDKTMNTQELPQRKLVRLVHFIQDHGIEAMVTVDGKIKAKDVWTYRDDANGVHTAEEWTILEPTSEAVFEFLNY